MSNKDAEAFDYLRAVRRRWRLVLLLMAIVAAVAVVVSLTSVKRYDATVDLLLRGQEPANALLEPGVSTGSDDPERELSTNVELIKITSTAEDVRRRLGLDRSTKALLDQVRTEQSNTSNIVGLTARDTDPVVAARIANAFAEAYVQFRLRSARQRYTEAAALAQRQLEAFSIENRDTPEGQELQSRQRELEIAAALQTGGVEIVRPASVPTEAALPRPVLSGILGVLLGLLLGVCAALALEFVDRRFKDEMEVEGFFELPILAAIPRPPRRSGALEGHAQREAFGLLAANLRLSGQRTGAARTIMVTSPGPGEGKTSVSFGVARACMQLGLRVILIEADLRRPAFSRYVDPGRSPGLTGVLGGSGELVDALIWLDGDAPDRSLAGTHDHDERIGVLPAGDLPANPQRMLSQARMRSLLESACSIADLVIIDTAPVGTVNDPVTMSELVGGVVLIARLNQTTKEGARRALRVLRNVDAQLAGVVVTDAGATEQYGYYPPASAGVPDESPGIGVAGASSAGRE